MIDNSTVRFTKHALERIGEMAITPEEIRAALLTPEEVIPSRKYEGCFNRRFGRVTLGTAIDADGVMVVTTVVWSTTKDWQADLETYGPYDGREEARVFRE